MSQAPIIFQETDHDCGAACLTMVARAHGHDLALVDAVAMSGTTHDGATALGLVQAARQLGLQARGLRVESVRVVPPHWAPLIAHILPMHFVVLDRIDSQGEVVILDPCVGRRQFSFAQFDASCSGIFIRVGARDGNQATRTGPGEGASPAGHSAGPTDRRSHE